MINKIKLSLGILIILLVMPLVNAFGVTTPYWDENPLIMFPGETKDVQLLLQSEADSDPLIARAELIEGGEVATMLDSNLDYNVEPGQKDVAVNIRITIPEDANLNDRYDVRVSFREILERGGGGPVQMATGVGTKIPVVVESFANAGEAVREPKTQATSISLTTSILLLAIIVIIIIAYTTLKNKTKKKK